jgi:hypothetical protein
MFFCLDEEAILGALRKFKPLSGPDLIPAFSCLTALNLFVNPYAFYLICLSNLVFFLMLGKSLKLYDIQKGGYP